MNTKLICATAAVFAACPLILHAQAAPPPAPLTAPAAPASPVAAPVTLRYKFVVGQVHRYKYNMDMAMLMDTGQTGAGIPMNMTMQMTMRQTVKSIRATDGAATVVSQIEGFHMLRNGQDTPMPEAETAKMKQPFTQVMLPTGKILSTDMPALNGGGAPGMDFSKGMISGTAFLPEGPIKIGDSWNGDVAIAMAGAQTAFKSTLAGVDQKNGATLATIHTKQTGTIEKTMTQGMPTAMKMQGQIAGTGSQIFDTTAGALQSATGITDMDMTMKFGSATEGAMPPGMPSAMKMQMRMKFDMQRLSDTPATTPPVQ